MKKIGITGSIGVGKSSFCGFLKQWGYFVISADDSSREAFKPDSPIFHKLIQIFKSPPQPLTSKWIAQKVFSDPKIKAHVEKHTHPFILNKILEEEKKILLQNPRFIFYEIPLLFEKKMEKYFDLIVLIYSPADKQKERVIHRFQLTPEQAQKRIESQIPQEEKLSKADIIIHNDKTLKDLKNKAQIFIQKLERNL